MDTLRKAAEIPMAVAGLLAHGLLTAFSLTWDGEEYQLLGARRVFIARGRTIAQRPGDASAFRLAGLADDREEPEDRVLAEDLVEVALEADIVLNDETEIVRGFRSPCPCVPDFLEWSCCSELGSSGSRQTC